MIAPVILASLLGWALLSLGLPRHHVAVFGSEPGPARSRRLRAAGWVLLALGLPVHVPELSAHRENPAHPDSVLRGLEEFREHLGGDLTITLLKEIGVGVEVHHRLDRRLPPPGFMAAPIIQ